MKLAIFFIALYGALYSVTNWALGSLGVMGDVIQSSPVWFLVLYTVVMTHVTITCMSLSFHRYHTHRGVKLNRYLDAMMQIWLWFVSGMSKLEWVSVHMYHHAHSDQEKDPHSPVQKGLWHVMLFGAVDYSIAKNWPEVRKIQDRLKRTKLETFLDQHPFLGLVLLSAFNIVMFGPMWGLVLSVINFAITPVFAVGGVNALAHWIGYRNHQSTDNSRNIGFLFPINFLVCGELDHNNHHKYQKSCSFRHRWFEFDIGYFYIKILSGLGLAEIRHVYNTRSLRDEMADHVGQLMEKDFRFKLRLEEYARECNMSVQELKQSIITYMRDRRVAIERPLKELVREAERTVRANFKLGLRYS